MKRAYMPPEVKTCTIEAEDEMLKSSYIDVGGHGSFDVKEQEDWDDEEPAPNPLPPIEVKNVWNKQW